MKEQERMLSGRLYDPYHVKDGLWEKSWQLRAEYEALDLQDKEGRTRILKELLGHCGSHPSIVPPFYCDKGKNIFIGDDFYANTGLIILDEAEVHIGDHCFFAPRVCIYTPNHPIDPEIRSKGLEYALPVHIGDNVWLGGNVIVNPGVRIGNNVVIGSGSVVTKDIPDNVAAAGNPCRIIRPISQSDLEKDRREYEDYCRDQDITF